jgi:TonB family protein
MKFITFLFLGLFLAFSPTLMAQKNSTKIQTEADKIKSKEGKISFAYAEKLLELTQAYQKEKDFEKAATLDQEVTLILKEFSDSIPENYAIEYAIKGQLEELLLEQYFTQWQGLIGQEKYALAQQFILSKDWIERSIKINQYLDLMNLFQTAHQTIGSQHNDYLDNWETAYNLYTNLNYYNLQQTNNLWKTIVLHRVKETEEGSPAHLELLFGYATFCDRTNDTKTYETITATLSKYSFYSTPKINPPSKESEKENQDKIEEIEGKEEIETDDEIYTIVEQMPRFPGCEGLEGDTDDKRACADKRLLRFIYTKIKYPNIARENGIEGMAVISFVVTEQGTITQSQILRDPGGACGQEALRVLKLMNELPRRWTPGRQRGKNVSVKYNLPVRFKLN